ncbi:hypothetical protein KPL70_010174 [Citrus sinensis]|uniref:Uncharacterized protein n=1 Tax=Citrus sinensis TaxID=2711 RepID=A0ACB8MQW5_CITSI|nr:hypothetical protein KPL70_010174 [Citrus sinensis]KAH9787947.1 hypothetical protein KPL71_010750 [Citrus sinensis]
MIIKDGHYQPGKHIAQELLHFPDQQLSKRQIQQFLGIINYIRDFLPHVDHHTHHLSALLKKQPPEWNADHTRAVTTLKQIAQNPPPLKLITDGKRILQTDASDESWGAILLEELNDKEHFIAYASGHFSDTQKHYHSVFKEILAVKNGIKKFEYHLIGYHFLIRMDSSAFPNIFHFKGKTVPEKMLLRLKDWFSKYDFSVKHIKGSQNLIPDMLSRLSKPQDPLTLFSTTYHFPIISMATSLPSEALTKKTFPFNKTFSSVFAIQEFARKALFRFFMKAYLVTDPFPFSTFHPENLFLTGLTLDPTKDTTEDVLWYTWCLTVLYATKLILPISPTLDHLLNPDNATSLTWTLLEWFSPIPWWRKKLQQLSEIYNLDRMPAPEAQMFTSVFIIHRPYFQHPDTHLFWTQDQVYEWFTAPHIAVIENDIQDVLHNYLCQLNHQPPPLKDISHTSLGPQHDLLMIPTPSAISKPKSTGIIIKEERPDYTDFLYQDSQDPWEDFLPLSQHLHQFPQPTMDEPGPSVPGPSTQSSKRPAQPSKVDKATQTSPKYTPKCTPRDYNCPYPPCRGPSYPPPPPAPLPIYRKELTWIAKHCKSEIPSSISNPTPPLACMMFSSTSSDYSSSFPSLDTHTDSQRNVVSKPFVPSPITSSGHLEPPKPFESVLNWQTQNARAQNDTLVNINSKVEKISLRTEQLETKVDSISAQMQQIHQNLQSRIGQLDSELRAMLAHRYNGPEFDQKEREIRRLRAELAQIESEKQRPTLFTSSPPIPSIGPTYHPFASMLSPIKQYDPSKLFGMTHTLFRDNPLPLPPKPKPKPRPQPRPPPLHPSSLTIPGQPSPTFIPTSPPAPLSVPAQSKDKEPLNQFTAHTVAHSSTTDDQTSDSNLAVSDSHTETDSESSASTSDSEKSYADITKILMAQPDQGQTSHTEPYVDIPSEVEDEMPESSATNQPSPAQPNPPSQKSSNGPWFTFDDLPSHKWRDRLNEMSAWIDLQMLRTGATTQSVLREFATRFTGALRDWFDSLGQYRQLQFVDLPEVSSALAVLHDQFLGDPSAVFEAARRDYLNMKCCSLNAKDLDFHYKRMSLLFYKLNGFNEPTLKHVFLASLPEELQPDIQRQLTASNLSLDNISLGKIFQLAKTCLDKLCEQKQFFKELLKDKEPFRSACKKPYLQIKCHKKKDCDCSSKKKRHFRKFKTPEFSSKPRRSRKPYRFFRKKSSSSREFKRKQSSRCFICKRKGHYAKDCPNKREKAIRLVEHLQATTDYSPAKDELEFYFSEQDEPNDETVFALQKLFI